MAQHDYVIANGTGAAVRSDINNGLAAIVSNNSGATAPSTTYAYQWWADTTTGLLKLRNAANNAWITLFQLDGEWSTLAIENGSAAAPSIYFKDSGTDTGVYSPGADQVAISTGGTGRLFVSSSGLVGIGQSSPGSALDVAGEIRIYPTSGAGTLRFGSGGAEKGKVSIDASSNYMVETAGVERLRITSAGLVGIGSNNPQSLLHLETDGTALRIVRGSAIGFAYNTGTASTDAFRIQSNGGSVDLFSAVNQPITFSAGTAEKARVDGSGRFLVGTSSSVPVLSSATGAAVQVNSSAFGSYAQTWFYGANNEFAPVIMLAKSRNTTYGSYTVVQNNDQLGGLWFAGDDGTDLNQSGAKIEAFVDGTPGNNDMPGRLVFSTTADGASSPTERMRISSTGKLNVFDSSGAGLRVNSAIGSSSTDNVFTGFYGASSTTAEGTASIAIRTNGDVRNTNNSYGALSDVKLKENIADANSQWDDLKAVRVRNFNFKEGQTHRQIGVIAQELELVSPGLVSESPDFDADGNDLGTVTKSVNYSVLYMKAVKALQEAMERIEVLEQRLTDAGIA